MKAQDYIQSKLDELVKPSGQKQPKDQEQLISDITRSVLSKKFRKYSLDTKVAEHVKNSIRINVEKNEPIKFTLPFGGYKLWRLDETPEADWAELFAIMYYTKWMKTVCEIYEPGAWFDFFSDDAVVKTLNNIPFEDTLAYRHSFKKILEFIKPYQPQNLDMTFTRVGDQYESQLEFDRELEQRVEETKKELRGFPVFDDSQKATIELNVKLTPEQGKDPLWREKVFLIHESYGKMSKRRPYYRIPEKIMVVATPLWGMLCVGTTKDSVAKFWCGAGTLRSVGSTYRMLVLSPSQLGKTEFAYHPVDFAELPLKNFSKIRVSE